MADPVADGLAILRESNALISARNNVRPEEYHLFAQRQALKISDFLGMYGEELDGSGRSDIVNALGSAFDGLNTGIQATLGATLKSPTAAAWRGFKDGIAESASRLWSGSSATAKWAVVGLGFWAVIEVVRTFRR